MSSKDEDINIFETENQKDEAPMDVVSRSSTPTEEDSIPKSDGIQSLQQNLSAGNLDPEDDTLQEIYAKLGQFLPSANKRKRESSSLERNIIEAVRNSLSRRHNMNTPRRRSKRLFPNSDKEEEEIQKEPMKITTNYIRWKKSLKNPIPTVLLCPLIQTTQQP